MILDALESLPRDAGLPRSASAKELLRRRFCLGGIALEVLPEPGFAWTLPAETEQHTLPFATLATLATGALSATSSRSRAPLLGAVTCSVRVDKSLALSEAASAPPAVAWEKTLDGICARARGVVLDIAAIGPRRFVASARIASSTLLTLMLNTLVTSVAELAGGLCLHATAVAHAGGAVLLLGPSGAGKTTAAELLGSGVTCLSNDRVTLVPDLVEVGTYWAWSLPVGKAPNIERCSAACLPVLALLRIRQARAPMLQPVREVEALMQIRQAVEVSTGSEFFEPQRLTAVAALAAAVKSGVAHVALASSWRAQLEAFLGVSAEGAQP